MLNQLKIEEEFTQDMIDQMSDSFVKYILEIASWGETIDENHMDAILEIVLIKYGTNIELPDDLIEIVTIFKELGNLNSVLKQFPESEVQRAFEQIKSTLNEVEKQIKETMEEQE